ncbi:hypothetical protein FJTKL_00629 [Diaporthe vaccinii]|uniref:Uncharacterized protein n=1 Tax=Diaporthe vaccinii TaxID=105482 RepID=A0ABR4F6M0_9PEZI
MRPLGTDGHFGCFVPPSKTESNPWVSINFHALNKYAVPPSFKKPLPPSPPRRARLARKGPRLVAARERRAPPGSPLVPELRPVPLPEADALLQLRFGPLWHVAGALGLDGAQLDLQVPELRLVLCDRLLELVDAGLLLPQSLICSFLSLDRYCV